MPRVTRAHREVGVCSESFRLTRTLAEGEVLALGPGGHVDQGVLLEDLITRSHSVRGLYVSSTLRGALGTTDDAEPIPANSFSVGIDTQVDTLFVCNRNGSGGTVVTGVTARETALNNSGQGPPAHPNSGCMAFVIPAVNSGPSQLTRTVKTRRTTVHVGVYAKTPRTLTGTYILTVRVRRGQSVWLLTAATFDLETLVAATLSAPALVAETARRVLEPGDIVEVIATSDATLAAGDLIVAVETEPLAL